MFSAVLCKCIAKYRHKTRQEIEYDINYSEIMFGRNMYKQSITKLRRKLSGTQSF